MRTEEESPVRDKVSGFSEQGLRKACDLGVVHVTGLMTKEALCKSFSCPHKPESSVILPWALSVLPLGLGTLDFENLLNRANFEKDAGEVYTQSLL